MSYQEWLLGFEEWKTTVNKVSVHLHELTKSQCKQADELFARAERRLEGTKCL